MNQASMRRRLATMLVMGWVALTVAIGSSAEPAQPANDGQMSFARGAKTWAENCARCHNMRNPNELRDDQWRASVAHMRVRANLTGQEARDVLAFLEAGIGALAASPAAAAMSVGRDLYGQTCVACHGADGKGALPGIVSFRAADGPLQKSDAVLTRSVLDGVRSAGSPLVMPPKGGNPTLTEADAKLLIEFLRAEFGS